MTSPHRRSPEHQTMTIGDLARRTGVPVKVVRRHEDLGLIYTLGRSSAGYRLFDQDALWCVEVIRTLRALGLTEAEIQQLARNHADGCRLLGPQLAAILRRVRARTEARIRELEQLQRRMEDFERRHHAALQGHSPGDSDPWGRNPTNEPTRPLTLPPVVDPSVGTASSTTDVPRRPTRRPAQPEGTPA